MMFYHFKKYFFDLNIDRETYVYFILVEIKFGPFKIRNFTLHYFQAGKVMLTKSKMVRLVIEKGGWRKLAVQGKTLDLQVEDEALHILANFRDLKLDLKIAPFTHFETLNNFVVPLRKSRIEWYAVPLFMTGTGTLTVDDHLITANQSPAYIDHVFSDIVPFRMPVSRMFWGRVLLPDLLVTYSVVIAPDRKQWARCFVFWNDKQYFFPEVRYELIHGVTEGQEPDNDENVYRLRTDDGQNQVEMTIKHVRTAADGAFIVPQRFRFKQAFDALNRMSRNPKGKKYISEATLQLHIEGHEVKYENLVCIDEYVIFI